MFLGLIVLINRTDLPLTFWHIKNRRGLLCLVQMLRSLFPCTMGVFCLCSHIPNSPLKSRRVKKERKRWGDGQTGDIAQHPNQCNHSPYQTASQSDESLDGEREREAAMEVSLPTHRYRHLFLISSTVLSLFLMSSLAIVWQGYLKATPQEEILGYHRACSYHTQPKQVALSPEGQTHWQSKSILDCCPAAVLHCGMKTVELVVLGEER